MVYIYFQVYVKDTSPKTDQKIEEQIVAITEKKQEQVNPILVSNVVRESNQQQFFVELSPKPIPKQIKSNNNYSTINSNTTMNITKEKFNQTNQTIQNINFNTCVTRNLEQKVEMSNQTMMLIDMETLIDAGLPSDYKKVTKDKCHESQSEQKQETSWTVNGVRVYKCDVCEKIFKRREHLYQHSKLHSGIFILVFLLTSTIVHYFYRRPTVLLHPLPENIFSQRTPDEAFDLA